MQHYTIDSTRAAYNEGVLAAFRHAPDKLAEACPYPASAAERTFWLEGMQRGLQSRTDFETPAFY